MSDFTKRVQQWNSENRSRIQRSNESNLAAERTRKRNEEARRLAEPRCVWGRSKKKAAETKTLPQEEPGSGQEMSHEEAIRRLRAAFPD
jgi:hypothetical protein